MGTNQTADRRHETSERSPVAMTRTDRMRAAVEKVVAVAPEFLRGDMDADRMANTMVQAVRDYAAQEGAAGDDGSPQNAENRNLQGALAELMGCGSGYLAGRCDAACVARTMTEMVREFAPRR